MLHILNGDTSAQILKRTRLAGEIVPWREALAVGPNPANLTDENRIALRAEYLSRAYNKDFADCKSELLALEHVIGRFSQHDEVVMWFEHDLFCQTNLIHLLSRLAAQERRQTKLSLICLDRYPGIRHFRGLAQLLPDQFESLFQHRQGVDETMLNLGHAAWQAFTAPEPQTLERMLRKEMPALPFLRDALKAHLARFPALQNGLGRLQHLTMDLIASGIDEFKPLFHMVDELEPAYGFGDAQIWNELSYLSRLGNPLVTFHGPPWGDDVPPSADVLENIHFKLTSLGKAVLVGNSDLLNVNRIDYWLGGVHLSEDDPVWRWDTEFEQMVAEE